MRVEQRLAGLGDNGRDEAVAPLPKQVGSALQDVGTHETRQPPHHLEGPTGPYDCLLDIRRFGDRHFSDGPAVEWGMDGLCCDDSLLGKWRVPC